MNIRGKNIETHDVVEVGKFLLIGAVVWKGLNIINNFGKDTTTGGGDGTSQDLENCLTFPNATKTQFYMQGLADAFEQAVWGNIIESMNEDDQTMAWILMQCNTDDDVRMLSCAYGKRGRGIVISQQKNLVNTVSTYLDPEWIDVVNQDYQNKGIIFRFTP